MPIDNEGQRQFELSYSQKRKLNSYRKAGQFCRMATEEIERSTARGDRVTVTINKYGYCDAGRILHECACREINKVPMSERNEKLAVVADAYLLSRRYIKRAAIFCAVSSCTAVFCIVGIPLSAFANPGLSVGCVAGAVIWVEHTSASFNIMMDFRQTKKLMKNILDENHIQTSVFLEKIKLSQMTLQDKCKTELSFMRIGRSKGVLPVNTQRTRDHLRKVFAGDSERLAKLEDILWNRSNYGYLPNQDDTEGGYLKEIAWREILKLCLAPTAIPSTDSNVVSNGENSPVRVIEPLASASTSYPPPTYGEAIAMGLYSQVI